MSRLPVVGQDGDIWGDVLNDYLNVSHDNDGTLKSSAVASAIPDGSVTSSRLSTGSVTNAKISDGAISEAKLDANVQAKLNAATNDPALGGDLTGTVSNAQLVDGAVDTSELATGAVTDAKISATANIAQSKIANLSADLANKYILPAGGIPESDLDSAVQTKLNSSGVSDNGVAALIQDTNSSTYAALVTAIQNVYATSYSPMSVVGARAGACPPTGAYPAGTAAGDVVVVTVSTNGGLPTPASGWNTLMTASGTIYYGCAMGVYAKVLDATDVSAGITGWSAGGVSYAIHVLRGVLLPTDVLVQNGWTDSTTYQLPAMTATDRAPKLVMTILTSLANQTGNIEYPAPYTDFVEFYAGGTSYIAQGVLRASTTASSYPLSDPNNHATWRTVSISLALTNP